MNTFFENIEPYLDDELSEQDKIAFETALQQDVNLQTALAEEKAVRVTLYLMMTKKFKDKIKNTQDKTIVIPIQSANNWRNWAIAATFLGVVLLSSLYFFNSKPDRTTLAAQYTFDYPTPQFQGEPNEATLQNTFYDLIKSKAYPKAITYYNSALSESVKQNSSNQFFYAFCQLKNKQFKEAIVSFQNIKKPPNELKEAIEWYVIISQLGNNQDISTVLEQLCNNSNHSFQKKALMLRDALK
jgi:tetratricopeptide (TPR) repeat protein